ncbi:MAG TPA: SprB repeat-containing protein, partial [Flavobacteriales bacterium]|nr:SprB repeat-containing protein [Flavobacteriales bacterium]
AISGGTAPFTIAWTDGLGFTSSNEDIGGIGAGLYQVSVTDANGCGASDQITLTAPAPISIDATLSSNNGTNVSCATSTDGSVDLDLTGGTAPFTFAWSNGSTDEDLTNVGAGSHTVLITDANGCTAGNNWTLTAPDTLNSVVASAIQPGGFGVTCAGGTDGSISTVIEGGTSPYAISWTGPDGSTSNASDISGLAAGSYGLTIIDANGCGTTNGIVLSEPPPIGIQITATTWNGGFNISCNGGSNGSIGAGANGGVPGYTYAWTGPGGFTSADANLSGTSAGAYILVVTDGNG